MGFWQRLIGREDGRKNATLDLFRQVYGGRESRSGVSVNWRSAIEVATVLACVRVLAEGCAQVPFRVYQDDGAGRKVVDKAHPLNLLMTRRPNPWQTPFELIETIVAHEALTANAYCFVNRVGMARTIKEIIPLEPQRMAVKQVDQRLVYTYTADDGRSQDIPAEAIWHIRGLSWNGWVGMDAVRLARDAIGLSIALEQTQADFHKNGAKTSGLFSVKEKLAPEKYAMLRAWFDAELQKTSPWRPLILDQDADYMPFNMSGVDAQHLETRKHQIEEICRGFRVMPIMIGHADKTATYASAEQMFLAHVVHTLGPLYRRIECSADANLLTDADAEAGRYTKFNANALMRGASADRANYYAKALGAGGTKGWMTQNDVRALEELDRSDDPKADELPQPTTKTPADAPADPPPSA